MSFSFWRLETFIQEYFLGTTPMPFEAIYTMHVFYLFIFNVSESITRAIQIACSNHHVLSKSTPSSVFEGVRRRFICTSAAL